MVAVVVLVWVMVATVAVVVLVWVVAVVLATPGLEREAAKEQGSRNMGNIGGCNMGGVCNNMGMVPHSNKEQGYIPHIPSLKEAR